VSRLSLRARLLLIGMALLSAGVLVTDAVAVDLLRRHLVERVDSELGFVGTVLGRLPIGSADNAQLPQAVADGLDLVSELYVAKLDDSGAVVAELRTPGVPARPALPTLDSAAVAARHRQAFSAGGWRVLAGPHVSGGSLVVAAETGPVNAVVARMWTITALTVLAVLVALAIVGWYAMWAGLRPLRRVEQTAAAIAAGDLTHRVPQLAPPRTEVGRLAASLNTMLAQLESAFAARERSEARMRTFLTDVSHELRTPLFGIKGFAELYRMGGLRRPGDVERTMRHIERESARLASLAEDLLLLARLDEDAPGTPGVLQPEPMDLRTVAADAYLDVQALDPARPVTLTGPGGGPSASAPVHGDEPALRRVVMNLVGNAIAHTPAGTPVRIGVGAEGDSAVLEVADEGPGVDRPDKVFDRFWKGAPSQGRGLGLAIVRSLVTAHGGTVELRTAPGEGATFRIRLPSTVDASG
jgi:two-component system OmpR family sensor kinase